MWAAVLAVVGLGGAMAISGDRVTAVFDRMAAAVNAGDAGAYASLYAPDAVITIHGGARLEGREAIERYEVELLREYPGVRLAFFSVWQDWPVAVVHYAVNGRTPSGPSMGHEGLLFYRFQESGLVEAESRYQDSLTPMAQLGLLGPVAARPVPALPPRMAAYTAKGSSSESANVATVTAVLAALNARSAAVPALADDVLLDEMPAPRPFHGRDGWQAAVAAWSAAVPDATAETRTILGVGDAVLVESVVRGTLRRPLGRFSASERPFTIHHGAIVHVKGGKLAHVSGFMNGKELAEALGQWPPAQPLTAPAVRPATK